IDRTVDVLKTMGGKKQAYQQFVGFAVETDQPEKNARNKLKNKNLDLVVLNNPNESGAAFAGDTNVVTIIGKNDSAKIAQQYKLDVSRAIFDALIAQKKGEGSDE
ncbi:MAG: bifunctional 4'-phosphopantothenoylcysteine decarboxylase/phosphopantothenoylcysteine synthetase, partial [Calditrichaeota bacterium]|nr:bifunctional 4'-phosphopantothenoylcysteine decarboxylase/phosphopantothenoylcysteine synthetase [Calditrichota bacterium]